MRLGHCRAHFGQPAGAERVGNRQGPPVFAEYVPATTAQYSWQFLTVSVKHNHGNYAQGAHAGCMPVEMFDSIFALVPALVVSRGGEGSLDFNTYDHDAVVAKFYRHVHAVE